MRFIKLNCFIFLLFLTNRTHAQLNTIAGYAYGYTDVGILNSVIDTFNALTPKLSSSMIHLNSMHGMELGLRYRFPHLSLEFAWSNKFARVSNKSTAGTTEVKNTLSFTNSIFSFGGEFYFGKVGIGSSFDINTIKIKTTKPGFSQRDESVSSTYIANQFFVSFELPVNNFMSLSIRPYVQLPAQAFNFYKTAGHLNSEIGPDVGQFQNKVVTYGIKILFINGEKNYETQD
jgi:hypothetical protein